TLWAMFAVYVLRAPPDIHHDCAMYLQSGQMLLDGAVPYVDVVEINPPLIMYLNVLPALAAWLTGWPPIPAFFACVLALVGWSVWQVYAEVQLLIGRAAAMIVAISWLGFNLVVWGGGVFGQREQLFLLFYVPFLLARSRRWGGATLSGGSLVLGVPAGLGT